MNSVQLYGNLGADPELRSTKGGTSVGTLRVATNSKTKNQDGQWVDQTEWHSVVVWGATAENCAKFLSKGRSVIVQGRLQTREWEDDTGATRYKTEIVADSVTFVGGRESASNHDRGSGGGSRPPVKRSNGYNRDDHYNKGHAGRGAPNDDFGDEEIPF